MGQIKTRCSAAAGLFLILLTVIAGFSSCKSNQKDIIPSAEYAPYVNRSEEHTSELQSH